MSADRQRLTSAIRRIAKTDPDIRGLLKAADNKGGKPGAAGVGSSTDAESQRICCDGSVSDNANPGVEDRDPNADGAGQDGGLNGSDPAKLDMGEGTLSGVTDCATGQPVCFDGAGFIPPEGWDAPTEPGPVDSYSEGFFWSSTTTKNVGLPTGEQFCQEVVPSRPIFTQPFSDPTQGKCVEYPGAYNFTKVYQYSCSEAPDNPACSGEVEPATADAWPSDGCVNLVIKGGTIVGSKYDPENDGSYSAPRTSIDLCSGTGQISLAPAANGGWKTINPTTDNGYLYNSKGEQIAHIDGNEYSDPSI